MTTQEIINTVIEICQKHIEVISVNYEERYSIKKGLQSIDITVFYNTTEGLRTNLCATVYKQDQFSFDILILRLREKITKECGTFLSLDLREIQTSIQP